MDYLSLFHLAHTNSTWFLQKKIALKENAGDFDRYYLKYYIRTYEKSITPHYTPLHEAIYQGHIEAVKILLNAGADKNKKIMLDIPNNEAANESKFLKCVYCEDFNENPNDFEMEHFIGFTAVDLAEKLMKNRENDTVSLEQRKMVYKLLNDN